ncbi:MAG: RIP metalloprotease RseP [Butyribacter sp.]|nr:RIP metalloprotease RseP [bacterium]MDY3855360.1 RIP metalloprotease RseP [Butyribacter sp.]
MNIIVALLIFTVIVVAHELGHFFLAKKNGVGVPEFSVGMGPRIITFAKTSSGFVVKFFCSGKVFEEREDWQDVTKYSWKLFPIGGSCAMIGEDEENDAENSFNAKGKWARFSIVFAGPFFNFIFAFIVSIIIIANTGIDYPKVEYVYDNQPAKEAGIEVGDMIQSVNGHKITIGREIDTYTQLHPLTGENVEIVVKRDGKEKTISLDPNYKTYLFGFSYSPDKASSTKISSITEGKPFEKAGISEGDKIISVNGTKVSNGEELKNAIDAQNADGKELTFEIEHKGKTKSYLVKPEPYETKTLGFFAAGDIKGGNAIDVLKYSVVEVKYWIETTVASLGQLITGKLGMDDLSGPVGIVDTVGNVLDQSKDYGMRAVVLNMLYMSVLLSANLGVMNLLPLPALDGGRILFILIEAVRGKPIDRDKEGYVNFAGFILLMLLMIFVMYNDILKLLH